jgi:hypothetical protein
MPNLHIADMSPLEGTMNLHEADLEHRERFKAFVLHDAEAWHREHLGRLYTSWQAWNAEFYGEAMQAPYLMFAEPKSPRVYGDTSNISGFGGRAQIRLRPSLLIGTHPHMRPEPAFAEGRFLFIADVLLHEMVHQYHFEITGNREDAFHGHGPHFRDVCNRIGQAFSLPPVRSSKKRGADRDLPSCAQWPHNVRPADYYQGAYVPPTPEIPIPTPLKVCQSCVKSADLAANALAIMERGRVLTLDEWHAVMDSLDAIIQSVPTIGDDESHEEEVARG